MYDEAKVNTVLIFARKHGEAVHENAQTDNTQALSQTCDGRQESAGENDGKCGAIEKG